MIQENSKKLIFTLDELTEQYGTNLEEIYRREKFQMVESLAMYLGQSERGKARTHIITTTSTLCMRLGVEEKLALMEALIAQVRNGVWKQ